MTLLTLVALLLALPVAADGPDDDKDKKKKADANKAEAVALHTPDYQNFFQSETGAKVYVTFGYGTVEQYFDADGDLQDLGEIAGNDFNAQLQSYIIHVGGTYDISQIGTMKVRLGADLSLAQRQAEQDAIPGILPEVDASSGFGLQNLTFFGEIAQPTYRLRAGYFLDLGNEPDRADVTDDRANSDEQDAVLLGLSAQRPSDDLRLYAGLDYFITLKTERDFLVDPATGTVAELEYDEGDVAILHAGVGYRITPTLEVGVTALYRINTEGEVENPLGDGDVDGDDNPFASASGPNEFAGGNTLGFVPHVTYAPVGTGYQIYLKGAVQREYFDYGYTVLGESDIAPRLGFTLGVEYGI